MIQHFIDPTSEKVVILTLEETKLITQSGNPLKPRETQKEFADIENAQEALEKKRWDTLKKGYVLNNENAKNGEAVLQVFIKSEYTGALSFQGVDNGVFLYQTLREQEP